MKVFILLCVVSGALGARVCGRNEEFYECGTACPKTCNNLNNSPKMCPAICVVGCQCSKGYVRASDGTCVLPSECPQERVCSKNERYYDCGTACPKTCENLNNPPKICPAMCVIGCQCAEGYVKASDGTCVLPSKCPDTKELSSDVCELPAVSGMCFAGFRRYHYDKTTGECKEFVYGGCGGNGNNFRTIKECQITCGEKKALSESYCKNYPDSGVCDAYMPRYYFDSYSGTCKTFVYGGCGGNKNNFKTEEECIAKCVE